MIKSMALESLLFISALKQRLVTTNETVTELHLGRLTTVL